MVHEVGTGDTGAGSGLPPESHHRSLFQEHPHAVFALDLEGMLTEVNPAAERISGFTAEKLLSMSFGDLVRADDLERAAAAFAEAVQRRPQRLELAVVVADSRSVDLSVTAIPLVVDGVVLGAYGVAEDVTERNRINRELQVTRELAATAAQTKTDFVARITHEIRTPLTSILATAELLAATTPTAADQRPLIDTLRRSSQRLLRLVDNVLDFASAGRAGRRSLEDFDLHAVLHDAVDLVSARARQQGLRLELDIEEGVPHRVHDHPTWTTQILVNLLSNAVDFTTEGEVRLGVSVLPPDAGLDQAGHVTVVYRVSDTGSGIAAADLEQVFEPFFRPASDRRTSGGAGLGLSIVRQLVDLGGGHVAVESTPGHGSVFTVTLPTALATG